jgi:hypothetical protein
LRQEQGEAVHELSGLFPGRQLPVTRYLGNRVGSVHAQIHTVALVPSCATQGAMYKYMMPTLSATLLPNDCRRGKPPAVP